MPCAPSKNRAPSTPAGAVNIGLVSTTSRSTSQAQEHQHPHLVQRRHPDAHNQEHLMVRPRKLLCITAPAVSTGQSICSEQVALAPSATNVSLGRLERRQHMLPDTRTHTSASNTLPTSAQATDRLPLCLPECVVRRCGGKSEPVLFSPPPMSRLGRGTVRVT